MNRRIVILALITIGLTGSFVSAQGTTDFRSGCDGKSADSAKPMLDWPPMRTKSGGLISDCVPMNLETAYSPKLVYPEAARAIGASGLVSVEVVIDKRGRVIWTNVVEGHPLLRSSALKTACKTRFKPTRDCLGRKLKMTTVIYYNFKL